MSRMRQPEGLVAAMNMVGFGLELDTSEFEMKILDVAARCTNRSINT